MDLSELERPPSPIPWPPLLVGVALFGGLALDRVLGTPRMSNGLLETLGGLLVLLAFANDIYCALTLRRHRTTIRPDRAPSALVTSGPYRYSRNPIYISHVALTLGLALLCGSLWASLSTLALIFALRKLAIEPEERFLGRKFGPAFANYVAQTPRWL